VNRAMARVGLGAGVLSIALLGGCVYYNGMYNTKRLAGSARQAERDGRPFEANTLWGQVVTRAESLVVRHPDSKYADEARIYQGIALARLGQCQEAMAPLGAAATVKLEGDVAEDAALALGRCRLELGDPAAAELALASVTDSKDRARRQEARLYRARALRLSGRADLALDALQDANDAPAAQERLLALAAADRVPEALALADSLLALGDTTRTWDSVVTTVGRSNPRVASQLVDRLARQPGATPVVQSRRMLEDAQRLATVDTARAAARLREAARIGPANGSAGEAKVRLIRLQVSRAASTADLAAVADTLNRLGELGGSAGTEAQLLTASLEGIRQAADSATLGVAQGDLRLFLAAEAARDSLHAPALASSLFRQLVEGWPDSPYAPKALLAGRSLDPSWGEQVSGLLEERYAGSPYMAFIRGEEAAGYRELEDSLQAFALSRAARPQRRQPPAAGRRPTAPSDEDRPRRGGGRRPNGSPPGLEP
jgi:hypothetical protein